MTSEKDALELASSWEYTRVPIEKIALSFLEMKELAEKFEKEKDMKPYVKDSITNKQDNTPIRTNISNGMSARDQFAMAALPGLIAIASYSKYARVKVAYEYADLMMRESSKPAIVPEINNLEA